jgi:hypothetical protein
MVSTMDIDDSNYIEIRNKIITGVRNGVKNLIKERKKTNGELVIMVKGKIKHIAAKDL